MRAPRYRFPDEVRSTTRSIAARMIQEGTIAQTPEELDTWISQRPDIQAPLEKGGYNTAFTAHDLFPLLQVAAEKAGGPAPEADAPPRSSRPRWLVAGLLLLVLMIVLLVLAVATDVLYVEEAGPSRGAYTRVGCTVGPGFEVTDVAMLEAGSEAATVVERRCTEMAELV